MLFLCVCLFFILMNLNPVLLHSMHVCLCVLQLYEVLLDTLPPGPVSIIPKEDYTSVAFSSLYSGAYHFKSNGHIMVKSPFKPTSGCIVGGRKRKESVTTLVSLVLQIADQNIFIQLKGNAHTVIYLCHWSIVGKLWCGFDLWPGLCKISPKRHLSRLVLVMQSTR